MDFKYRKVHSTSFIIREKQLQTISSYSFLPFRQEQIKDLVTYLAGNFVSKSVGK